MKKICLIRGKIRIVIFLLAVILIMFMAGCTAAPPESPAEELVCHIWLPQKCEGQLSFEDNTLLMNVRQGDNEVLLSGEYLTDNEHLTVLSKDYGTVVMKYRLSEDKLFLSWFGKEMTFVKDNSFTSEEADVPSQDSSKG